MSALGGRRALVTGATTGIGRATVQVLAARGAAVAVNHHDDEEGARELVAQLTDGGARAVDVLADVSDEDAVAEMVERVAADLGGPVDLLVNNAGVQTETPLVDLPLRDWQMVLSVNLTGPFLCTRAVARALIAAGRPGVVVNVSSVHEELAWPGAAHYCSAKGGLRMLTRTAARELAPHGIRVVSIAPGAILTERNAEVADDRELVAAIPAGRIGGEDEMADAIAWLASEEAAYMVGRSLVLDGGMTLGTR
ncbi:MAG TPA: SDR family oxidoreductase [Miltoncostaeaceae bacterium]|nr:SDR family oxidoreductase [Miltoncostaeaceae bacterium]